MSGRRAQRADASDAVRQVARLEEGPISHRIQQHLQTGEHFLFNFWIDNLSLLKFLLGWHIRIALFVTNLNSNEVFVISILSGLAFKDNFQHHLVS